MLVVFVLTGVVYWAFRNVGSWLVVADPLKRARAIVVLSGGAPFRAMGAASLYHQGWAPEIWITAGYDRRASEAYLRLGVPYTQESEYSRRVLEKLGVPADAIRVLPTPIRNTVDEVSVTAAALRRENGDVVIIITSPPHTRRVRTIWRLEMGDHPQAIVCYDSYEEYDPKRWWRITVEGDDVIREILGLFNAWLGFPAKPKEQLRWTGSTP